MPKVITSNSHFVKVPSTDLQCWCELECPYSTSTEMVWDKCHKWQVEGQSGVKSTSSAMHPHVLCSLKLAVIWPAWTFYLEMFKWVWLQWWMCFPWWDDTSPIWSLKRRTASSTAPQSALCLAPEKAAGLSGQCHFPCECQGILGVSGGLKSISCCHAVCLSCRNKRTKLKIISALLQIFWLESAVLHSKSRKKAGRDGSPQRHAWACPTCFSWRWASAPQTPGSGRTAQQMDSLSPVELPSLSSSIERVVTT